MLNLATIFPLPVLALLGDAPVEALVPAGATFDPASLIPYVLPALGLFLVSLAASFWSDYVRRLGPQAKPWMLSLSAALNLAAGNPHKAARAKAAGLAKAARE